MAHKTTARSKSRTGQGRPARAHERHRSALQILAHLQETGSPAGAYAIVRARGAPQSTVYFIINDLTRNLLQRRHDGTLRLGPRLYHCGLADARLLNSLWPPTKCTSSAAMSERRC